ncbi:MAG TPA: flippase [Bacteroidetes bacterium]|nr:flippase [Bacteroidota bacterium]
MLSLKKRLKVNDNRVLLSNFFSLSALQVMTYVFPIITFPYLVRVLGVEIFGVLAMATAMVAYLHILTDYGFDLSGTKEISIHRDDCERVSEIFSAIMIIKSLFMLMSIVILSVIVFSFEKFSEYWEVYFLSYGLVIGQALFPVWFFQGMERMKYITILTIASKTLFTILIFVLVHDKEDFLMVPLLYALGAISSGMIALYLIKKDFGVKFSWQSADTIHKYLKDGWNIFMQRLYVNLHNNMAYTLVLGLLTNDMIVGIFSIATRLIGIVGELFKVASKVYYPYFSKRFVSDPHQAFRNLTKVIRVVLTLSTISMILLFVLNEFLLKLITGTNFNPLMVDVLQILTFGVIMLPFFTLFTNVMVAVNRSKELKNIARDTAIINTLLIVPVIYFSGVIGLAYLSILLQIMIIIRYSQIILTVNKTL